MTWKAVAALFASGLVAISGCGSSDAVVVKEEHWECVKLQCKVSFTMFNESNRSRSVAYVTRAHRVSNIISGEGARRNEVVGERRGTTELAAMESRRIEEFLSVVAKPSQVVTTAWLDK